MADEKVGMAITKIVVAGSGTAVATGAEKTGDAVQLFSLDLGTLAAGLTIVFTIMQIIVIAPKFIEKIKNILGSSKEAPDADKA